MCMPDDYRRALDALTDGEGKAAARDEEIRAGNAKIASLLEEQIAVQERIAALLESRGPDLARALASSINGGIGPDTTTPLH